MFERFFQFNRSQTVTQEDKFFSEIENYSDLKVIFSKMLVSKTAQNCVLDGPPASGKTLFLLAIQKGMKDVHFIDAPNATGPGMIEKLFLYPKTKFLLIDEIEKMSKKDQNTLLNVLETGVLTSTKVKKQGTLVFKGLKVFATTNDIDAISKPLRSRMMAFHLPEYTYEQFTEISITLLSKRFKLGSEVAEEIARVVWEEMGQKDMRRVLQIGSLVTSVHEVKGIAKTLMKYSQENRGREDE